MAKTLYFNIEDDVKSITERLRREPGTDFTLVFPRRSYIFSDPVNLKLLKKQLDVLRKSASFLTMDERGRQSAEEAGFALQDLPSSKGRVGTSDIAVRSTHVPQHAAVHHDEPEGEAVPVEINQVTASATTPSSVSGRTGPTARPKIRPTVRPMPAIAVHDTIFSDVPKRGTFGNNELDQLRPKPRRRTAILGGVVIAVLVAVVLLVYVLPSAQVTVYAKSESVTRDLEIAMSTATKTTDVQTLSMPATGFDQTYDVQNKFDTTGKKEIGSKAQGKVRIFNITGSSINLKASTTTLSSGDKKFTFSTDQNYIKAVSAKTVSNPNSGHLAAVVAVEGGESMNLPVGTRLEITNKVFGSKPEQLYAVVDEAFTGGSSRFVSVIEQADITKAQEELTRSAVTQLSDALKGEGLYLAELAYNATVISFTTDKPVGSESPTFTAQLSVQLKGASFDPVVLTGLVRDRVTQVLPTGGHLQPAAKDVMTFKVRQVDPAAGTLRLIVHFESRMLRDVDIDPLAEKLAGLSSDKAQASLTQNGNIAKADIVLKPSWQKSLPKLSSRIEVVEKEE